MAGSGSGESFGGLRIGAIVLGMVAGIALVLGVISVTADGTDTDTTSSPTDTASTPPTNTRPAMADTTPPEPTKPAPTPSFTPTLVLLDNSASMGVLLSDGRSRLEHTAAALEAAWADASAPTVIGLWTYAGSTTPDRLVSPAELGEAGAAGAARQRLGDALAGIAPSGGTWTFPNLAATVAVVPELGVQRVLLVTDGPRDYSRMTAAQLRAAIAAATGAHPVRVDVLLLQADESAAVLREISRRTGGRVEAFGDVLESDFGERAAALVRS